MLSHTCPHGVEREMLFEGGELRAFLENCKVCTVRWKSGDDILITHWVTELMIGQVTNIGSWIEYD